MITNYYLSHSPILVHAQDAASRLTGCTGLVAGKNAKQICEDCSDILVTSSQGCTRYKKVLKTVVPLPLLDKTAECRVTHSWACKGHAAHAGLSVTRQLVQEPQSA